MEERNSQEPEIEYITIDWDEERSEKGVSTEPEQIFFDEIDHFDYEAASLPTPKKYVSIVKSIFTYLAIVAAAALVATFVMQYVILNAHIPSSSMEPTVDEGDRLLCFRLAYVNDGPERGDIIVFKFPDDESQTFIKRVIGLPGDEVVITDGVLYINGEVYEEDYLKEPMAGDFGPYDVPENCYFVMGDNRNVSKDARFWDNTYVTRDEILAKAWLRYSPNFTNLWQ